MNLLVDIGNKRVKHFVTEQNQIIATLASRRINRTWIKHWNKTPYDGIIISNVRKELNGQVQSFFSTISKKVLFLSFTTQLPITLCYEETLGTDRIATAVGANALYPTRNLLVIDLGTAITYDIINNNATFCGGNITAGWVTRCKALNLFTHKLPNGYKKKKEVHQEIQAFGGSTLLAISFGAIQGIIGEIQYHIDLAQKKYDDVKVIVTGGDAHFYKDKIDREIEYIEHLAAHGLETILEYNNNL